MAVPALAADDLQMLENSAVMPAPAGTSRAGALPRR